MSDVGVYVVLILVLWFAFDRYKKCKTRSAFSMPNQPFEPDNTLFLRNPFDNFDYIKPTFRRTDDLSVLGLNRSVGPR